MSSFSSGFSLLQRFLIFKHVVGVVWSDVSWLQVFLEVLIEVRSDSLLSGHAVVSSTASLQLALAGVLDLALSHPQHIDQSINSLVGLMKVSLQVLLLGLGVLRLFIRLVVFVVSDLLFVRIPIGDKVLNLLLSGDNLVMDNFFEGVSRLVILVRMSVIDLVLIDISLCIDVPLGLASLPPVGLGIEISLLHELHPSLG